MLVEDREIAELYVAELYVVAQLSGDLTRLESVLAPSNAGAALTL